MELPRLEKSSSSSEVAQALKEAGCVVIEHLVSEEVMSQIGLEIRPFIDSTPFGPDSFTGKKTKRAGSLIARSNSFHELASHPTVVGAARDVICQTATTIQIHLTQVIEIGPGSDAQPIHRDQWAWDSFPFPQDWEVEVSTMWALTHFTEENGATRVIPGSHLWKDELRPSFEETIPAIMPSGSVLLYTGSLYHGGGKNLTADSRTGVNVDYSASFLRQEENQYLACPPEVAAQIDPDLAKLIGYSTGSYALGYFGDLQDPMEALDTFKDRTSR